MHGRFWKRSRQGSKDATRHLSRIEGRMSATNCRTGCTHEQAVQPDRAPIGRRPLRRCHNFCQHALAEIPKCGRKLKQLRAARDKAAFELGRLEAAVSALSGWPQGQSKPRTHVERSRLLLEGRLVSRKKRDGRSETRTS